MEDCLLSTTKIENKSVVQVNNPIFMRINY